MTTLTQTETKSELAETYLQAKKEYDRLQEIAKSHKAVMEDSLNKIAVDVPAGEKLDITVYGNATVVFTHAKESESVSYANVIKSIRPLLSDDMQDTLDTLIKGNSKPKAGAKTIKKK